MAGRYWLFGRVFGGQVRGLSPERGTLLIMRAFRLWLGTRAWILLLLARDGDDPLFLQAKEAQASVLEPFLGKSEFANHGQRIVEGQRLVQAASDISLAGSTRRRAWTVSRATSTSASSGMPKARRSSR